MTVTGGTIDEYLDNLANEFLRIMNTQLANQNPPLPIIDTNQFGDDWRTKLRESLGTTDTDKKARV